MVVFRAHLHMWHRRKISQGPLGHSSAKPLGFLAGMADLIYAGRHGTIFLVWSRLSFVCVCVWGGVVVVVRHTHVYAWVHVHMYACACEGQRTVSSVISLIYYVLRQRLLLTWCSTQ